MPDRVKEKLSDLLYEASRKADPERYIFDQIADNLIANGVTFAEDNNVPTKWIPVKDRLPTAEDALTDGSVYAYTKAKKVLVLHYQYVCRRSDYILCWMPIAMPQPPKEVEQ